MNDSADETSRGIVEHWDIQFGLPRGLSATACVDLILTYTGPSTYRQLVVDYRWTTNAYQRWLRETRTDLIESSEDARPTVG